MKLKKITLTEFIRQYYLLGFLGESKNKNGKIFLEFDKKSESELIEILKQYSNLKIRYSYCQYAPEIKKIWIALI